MVHPGTTSSSFRQTSILRSQSLLSERKSRSSTHIHHHIAVLNYSQVASKPIHPGKGPFPNRRTRDSTADWADSLLHQNYLSIYLSISSFIPEHRRHIRPQSASFSNKQRTLSDQNQAQPYFLEVFLAVFLELLAFASFELFLEAFSSFLAALLAIATCFTIFCSSTRNARRMLHTHSHTQFLTDHGHTCGTDFHHTHGTQCAGSESRSSDR